MFRNFRVISLFRESVIYVWMKLRFSPHNGHRPGLFSMLLLRRVAQSHLESTMSHGMVRDVFLIKRLFN